MHTFALGARVQFLTLLSTTPVHNDTLTFETSDEGNQLCAILSIISDIYMYLKLDRYLYFLHVLVKSMFQSNYMQEKEMGCQIFN